MTVVHDDELCEERMDVPRRRTQTWREAKRGKNGRRSTVAAVGRETGVMESDYFVFHPKDACTSLPSSLAQLDALPPYTPTPVKRYTRGHTNDHFRLNR